MPIDILVLIFDQLFFPPNPPWIILFGHDYGSEHPLFSNIELRKCVYSGDNGDIMEPIIYKSIII